MRDRHATEPRPGGRRRRRSQLKVVVRQLPAHLPEDVFWCAVSPWVKRGPDGANVSFAEYIPGKPASAAHKRDQTSVAYVRFIDAADMTAFMRGFDGHILRDKHGRESVARVELALYQTVATAAPARKDPLHATIEEAPEYQAFLAALDGPPEPAPAPAPAPAAADETTPLVAYINRKRQERNKSRDARRGRGRVVTVLKPPRRDTDTPSTQPEHKAPDTRTESPSQRGRGRGRGRSRGRGGRGRGRGT